MASAGRFLRAQFDVEASRAFQGRQESWSCCERDAWSSTNGSRQATNGEHYYSLLLLLLLPPPPPPLPPPLLFAPLLRDTNLFSAATRPPSAASILPDISSALSASSFHLPNSAESRRSWTRSRASRPRHLSPSSAFPWQLAVQCAAGRRRRRRGWG